MVIFSAKRLPVKHDLRQEREQFISYPREKGIQTRPVWTLMTHLPMYRHCQSALIEIAQWLENRLVHIPSSVRI